MHKDMAECMVNPELTCKLVFEMIPDLFRINLERGQKWKYMLPFWKNLKDSFKSSLLAHCIIPHRVEEVLAASYSLHRTAHQEREEMH